MAADSIIATIVASKIPQLYPNTLSGAVNIETVIAPIETKKMIPKFTIPVYPVCKFREKAIKISSKYEIPAKRRRVKWARLRLSICPWAQKHFEDRIFDLLALVSIIY